MGFRSYLALAMLLAVFTVRGLLCGLAGSVSVVYWS